MEIKDFEGIGKLSGIDRTTESRERYGSSEDCEVLRFELNGICYEVSENPDDGYRSSHEEPIVYDGKIKNTFKAVLIAGLHKTQAQDGTDDIMEFYSVKTGEKILSFGTNNVDDYYPYWVCEFSAEELDKASKS